MIELRHPYIPAWPPLSPLHLLPRRPRRELPFPFSAPLRTYFFRASYAIYHLFSALCREAGGTVLVPDYNSGNEVMAMRAAGATLRYYPIKKNLEADLEALRRLCREDARVLYVIHYAGWPQPIVEMARLCREFGLVLVEDCALSLLGDVRGEPIGSFGDYSVFCLYKTIPVPNGGVLVQNRGPLDALAGFESEPCSALTTASRGSELLLEWLRSHANGLGRSLFALKRRTGKVLRSANIETLRVGNIGFDLDHVNTEIDRILI